MSVWLIEPLDPLIARDGRPAAVGRFTTTSFPSPSMVAGAVRTRMGSEEGAFTLPGHALTELKEKVLVRGPLLAELSPEEGTIHQWLAPAPRDAMILDPGDGVPALRQLTPRALKPGQTMDSFGREGDLLPLCFQGAGISGKPPQKVPTFWTWAELESWLLAPADRSAVDLPSLGVCPLPVEVRAHLAIQPGERVGLDGMLFQTAGLRFLQEGKTALAPRRFALSLWCQGATVDGRSLELRQQLAPLGGERRLARWSPASEGWPEMPGDLKESIVKNRRARLVLLTPALFEHGPFPAWSGGAWPLGNGMKVTVRAAAMPRPEVVSGWDLAKGTAKPTRRLAPAGSVYFVELEGTPASIRQWCEETWLACVSDDAQDRRDGFGLAVLGTWKEDVQ
jgi:CRISPR-associated protein Cmr3